MPKIGDNLLATNTSTLNTGSKRSSSADRSENDDSFQKMLDDSRPKAREQAEPSKETANAEKQPEPSKRADAASRRRKPAEGDQDQMNQPDQVNQQGQVDQPQNTKSTGAESTQSAETPPPEQPVAEAQSDPAKAPEEPKQSADTADATDATNAGAQDVAAAVVAASPPSQPTKPAQPPAATDHEAPIVKDSAILASETVVNPSPEKPVAKQVGARAKAAGANAVALKGASTEAVAAKDAQETQQQATSDTDPQSEPARQIAQATSMQSGDRPRKVAAWGNTASAPAPDVKPNVSPSTEQSQQAASAVAAVDVLAQLSDPASAPESSGDIAAPTRVSSAGDDSDRLMQTLQAPANPKSEAPASVKAPAPSPAPVPPEVEFGDANHDRIVTSLRSQLLPNGGTMHIRLDPPELGVLQVTVRMQDGVMTASFETSNDQATRLLSHSLGQLKTVLESQGVSVEKLHVQQTPKDQQSTSSGDDRRQNAQQDGQSSTRQEQQRREMLQRMWRRLGIGHDPLDMVA